MFVAPLLPLLRPAAVSGLLPRLPAMALPLLRPAAATMGSMPACDYSALESGGYIPEITVLIVIGWVLFRCAGHAREGLGESVTTYYHVLVLSSTSAYLCFGFAASLAYLQCMCAATAGCLLLLLVFVVGSVETR